MDKLLEKLQALPKAVQIAFAVILFALLGYGMYVMVVGGGEDAPQEQTTGGNAVAEFPDANSMEAGGSRLDSYRKSDRSGSSSANMYWESLEEEQEEDEDELIREGHGSGGLKVSGKDGGKDDEYYYKGEYLDPKIYSELERYYIKNGICSKFEIDRSHQELKTIHEDNRRNQERVDRQMRENSDSAMMERLEKAMAVTEKYTAKVAEGSKDKGQEVKPVQQVPSEPELRHIDVQNRTLKTTTLMDDGIITSLDAPQVSGVAGGTDGAGDLIPAKATFMKDEALVTGQRVIMRLVQDLRLSDGTLIPANTHIVGICKVSNRLNIEIKTLNYGGKIYYTNLYVFDNDGTEGIYCPKIVDDRAQKSKKKVGKSVGQAMSSAVSSLASLANPYAANVARTGMNEIVSSIDDNGNLSVRVCSGYEFYMFEIVEKNKK